MWANLIKRFPIRKKDYSVIELSDVIHYSILNRFMNFSNFKTFKKFSDS